MAGQKERLDKVERELDRLHDRIDSVNSMGENTARLAVQTANRQGVEVAKRSLVFFVKGGLKGTLMEKLAAWEHTSRLPHDQRPAERPKPFKIQVAEVFVDYLVNKATGMADSSELDIAKGLPSMVDAVSHPKPRSGDQEVWPLQVTLRGSEGAQRVKDAWLSPSFNTMLGKEHDLGLKVSRYLPGMATRLVMRDLGEEPAVKGEGKGQPGRGSQRRSPKREAEGSLQDTRRRRQRG